MTQITLRTENEAWGFYGTMTQRGENADKAWTLAMAAISDATCCDEAEVRAFLDSRHGRHFADDVNVVTGTAIDAAINRWMGWRISNKTSRETGIPVGLPFLTGYVISCGFDAA